MDNVQKNKIFALLCHRHRRIDLMWKTIDSLLRFIAAHMRKGLTGKPVATSQRHLLA